MRYSSETEINAINRLRINIENNRSEYGDSLEQVTKEDEKQPTFSEEELMILKNQRKRKK